jgi:hypothetical protein
MNTTQVVEVKNLIGEALDWAVAHLQKLPVKPDPMGFKTGSEAGFWIWPDAGKGYKSIGRDYSPSSKWDQGGQIIEHEKLTLIGASQFDTNWTAMDGGQTIKQNGQTALIAAMRAYVHINCGSSIEIPTSLAV